MVGNITLSLMVGKPAICCFVAIEKRHIAAALLLCPEDGARGLFSYLLCFFLLATTAVPMAALPLLAAGENRHSEPGKNRQKRSK